MFPAGRNHDTSAGIFFGSSRKVGGANKSLGEAPKSCTRKEHESATNSIARRGQGTASLVGFGATPQLFRVKPTQRKKSTRRRQRSVPASNFALPQERPQAALSNLPHIVAPNGRDHIVDLATIVALFRKQGISRLRARPKGMKTGETCDRPLETFGAHSHVS